MTLRLVAVLLTLLVPVPGLAATVAPAAPAFADWPPSDRAARLHPGEPPILQARLMMRELALLPSGRVVALPVVAAARMPLPPDPAQSLLVVLPLPGAMPLFLGALAWFILFGRRPRRTARVRS